MHQISHYSTLEFLNGKQDAKYNKQLSMIPSVTIILGETREWAVK